MSAEQEQSDEIEALQSIFITEFEEVDLPREYKLNLTPTPDEENHVSLTFHVTYPAEYPEVPLTYTLENIVGIDDDAQLHELVRAALEENAGMPMAYPAAEALQTWLQENNHPPVSMHEQMQARMKAENPEEDEDEEEAEEKEEEEWRGLEMKPLCPADQRLTPETFAAWKVKFDQEMIAAGILKREAKTKRSGRQIFVAGETAADTAAAEEAAENEAVSEDIVVDEALFDGDDDLDDLDEIEDD
jgi:hypothetical protein